MTSAGPYEPLPFEDAWRERTVAARFAYVAAAVPDKLAIRTSEAGFTYSELDLWTNRLANHILALRGPGTDVIGLLLDETARTIAGMVAVCKTGKCYLPLAPDLPDSRLEYIAADSGMQLLVTDSQRLDLARAIAGPGVRIVDVDGDLADAPNHAPGAPIDIDDPMMMLYTSGSTGVPKGIQSSFRIRMDSSIEQTRLQGFTVNDRSLLLASTSVSASRGVISFSLLTGGSLHPYNPRRNGLAGLAAWMHQERVTIYHSTPSVFRSFAEFLGPEDQFPDVRLIRLGGEPILKSDIGIFKRHFPKEDAVVRISYASSEASNIAHDFVNRDTEIPGNVVPVGYPSPGREVFIRDEDDRPAADGEIGEIIVRSRFTAKQYWDRPEKSRQTFWEDPAEPGMFFHRTGDLGRLLPDGRLQLAGRADGMVKIRGYRVELAEIEGALSLLSGIKEAAVVLTGPAGEEQRLAAYYVPSGPEVPSPDRLREILAGKLPEYAVPQFFIPLERLPLNAGGKIDRNSLPAPSAARPQLANPYEPPRTELEAQLAGIWGEVLGLEKVGVRDRFFDLGGHSLLASRIISRVLKHFRVEVPLQELLEAPTIAEMAGMIQAHERQALSDTRFEALVREIEALSDEEVRELLGEG